MAVLVGAFVIGNQPHICKIAYCGSLKPLPRKLKTLLTLVAFKLSYCNLNPILCACAPCCVWMPLSRASFAELDNKLGKLSERFTFKEGSGEKLGTIKGVFIPTLQNILGIILFVRLPWITGQVFFLND